MDGLIEHGRDRKRAWAQGKLQVSWGERRYGRDRRPGWRPANGRDLLLFALLVVAAVVVFAVVGALTSLADRPGLEAWKAWTWSLTSAATAVPCMAICWWAARRASPSEWGWPRSLLIHGAGSLIYAGLHVGGFVLLRNIVYAAMGENYGLGPLIEDFPYELRKDLLTYSVNVTLFWMMGEIQARRAVSPTPRLKAHPPCSTSKREPA